MTKPVDRLAAKRARGGKARKDGRLSEFTAAFWLIATGWRILAFRLKTPHGEIDILARKGAVLAVIEVKRRATLEAALEAVTYRQRQRLTAAAQGLAAKRRLSVFGVGDR